MSNKAPVLPVLNAGNPLEIFAAELTAVEDMGPCVRLVFTVPRQSGREAFREPCVYVVVPAAIRGAMASLLHRDPRPIINGQPDAEFAADDIYEHKIH